MFADSPLIDVTDNCDQNRFELRLNGDLVGIVGYYDTSPAGKDREPDSVPVISFMHTVVVEDFGHRGLAAVMVRHALDHARSCGWKIRPVCTYVQRFVEANPEYRDLMVPLDVPA
ncbi:GNAT family N-acetyltransferase [Rhodococcus spongiicola]|uniref:N-acetyltransferase n=1 Tax=Rhodococcus spongiicola TaxID=2487352 RepID=A0A438ASL8_9NOCA|nr:GNAT family N-acetyltransferase [Rhodococcus spongiicola]RVW01656.1 N-acetyltransferase [Rhodococcus spongiicola]